MPKEPRLELIDRFDELAMLLSSLVPGLQAPDVKVKELIDAVSMPERLRTQFHQIRRMRNRSAHPEGNPPGDFEVRSTLGLLETCVRELHTLLGLDPLTLEELHELPPDVTFAELPENVQVGLVLGRDQSVRTEAEVQVLTAFRARCAREVQAMNAAHPEWKRSTNWTLLPWPGVLCTALAALGVLAVFLVVVYLAVTGTPAESEGLLLMVALLLGGGVLGALTFLQAHGVRTMTDSSTPPSLKPPRWQTALAFLACMVAAAALIKGGFLRGTVIFFELLGLLSVLIYRELPVGAWRGPANIMEIGLSTDAQAYVQALRDQAAHKQVLSQVN
ncbi:hypothetical protein [Deinococcus marmoris]|uniref:hypothetical protein n=1 Tax=Deinococcus marmoris TaxID=249408 RepID=UPI0004979249|nr:hypothetical protein [Deinococcus marmoris]